MPRRCCSRRDRHDLGISQVLVPGIVSLKVQASGRDGISARRNTPESESAPADPFPRGPPSLQPVICFFDGVAPSNGRHAMPANGFPWLSRKTPVTVPPCWAGNVLNQKSKRDETPSMVCRYTTGKVERKTEDSGSVLI